MTDATARPTRPEMAEAVIRHARRLIADNGLQGFNARELAKAVGCSVGTIYNIFPNLEIIRAHVNGETLDQLLAAVTDADAAAVAAGATFPEDRLMALARAYVAFAGRHLRLYEALLDRRAPLGEPPPDWLLQKIAALRLTVEEAIAPLFTREEAEARTRAATTIWASVNGLCEAVVTGNLLAISRADPDGLMRDLVRTLVAGLRARRG